MSPVDDESIYRFFTSVFLGDQVLRPIRHVYTSAFIRGPTIPLPALGWMFAPWVIVSRAKFVPYRAPAVRRRGEDGLEELGSTEFQHGGGGDTGDIVRVEG